MKATVLNSHPPNNPSIYSVRQRKPIPEMPFWAYVQAVEQRVILMKKIGAPLANQRLPTVEREQGI